MTDPWRWCKMNNVTRHPIHHSEQLRMIAVDEIAKKAGRLYPAHLELLADYVELLLTDQQRRASRTEPLEPSTSPYGSPFPTTRLESLDAPSVYRGPPLSLEQMQEAVDWEAGRRR
jgi:hypothetical protein